MQPKYLQIAMDILNAVAFFVGVFIMYWSMPIACLLYKIRFLSFGGKRDDMFQWSMFVADSFGITIHKVGSSELHRTTDPIMYIANHRSWADFFIDVCVTEGRAALLSRWAVFPVFPVFLMSGLILKGVVFFKRNRIQDKDVFNNFLDSCIHSSPISGLMIYPEGHRSTLPTSLPLRRGMLKYAHSRRMPIQIAITKNKERVLSEKNLSAGFGVHLIVGYSELITVDGDEDFELFFGKVQASWDAVWATVYAADASEPVLVSQGAPGCELPFETKLQQAVYSVAAITLLLSIVVGMLKLLSLTKFGLPVCLGLVTLVMLAIQRATVPAPVLKAHT